MGNRIKPGEKMTLEYFQSIGYTDIIHEPDPNHPPDLLLNGTIAVEARRLNQFKHINGVNQPLEKLEHEVMPRVKKIIRSFDKQPSDLTSFVMVDYRRPLKADKTLEKKVHNILTHHLNFLDQTVYYDVTPSLQLRCRPSAGNKKYKKPYVWSASYDSDSGGFVVGNIYRSLQIIIKEKEEKVLPFKDKYPTWWLAVTDSIGYGLADMDIDQLKEAFDIPTFFERIIFISPFDSKNGKELILKPALTASH